MSVFSLLGRVGEKKKIKCWGEELGFFNFFFFHIKCQVTCGNFQSISVCSLMFKLNFTSFVIVTPAALVMVKCM